MASSGPGGVALGILWGGFISCVGGFTDVRAGDLSGANDKHTPTRYLLNFAYRRVIAEFMACIENENTRDKCR